MVVDLSQIIPVGAGISEPVIAKPKSIDEAKENISTAAKELLATGDLSKVVDYLLAFISSSPILMFQL